MTVSIFDPRVSVLRDIEMRMSQKNSLNRLCDISDWVVGGKLTQIMKELNEGCYIHRKAWEYALCILGLDQLGVVRPESRAVAVGAGSERPLFYFANKIQEMVATDLYDNPDHEGNPAMLTTPERFAPFDYRRGHLTVKRMSGTELGYADSTFDFAFSLSSIEHFGSRENSKKAVVEMERVLKPGGIACIATELILNGASHPEYFTLDELKVNILESSGMRLVGGDLDLRISRSLVENPIELDVETNHQVSPLIVLKVGGMVWTSVMLFMQKA